MSSIQADIDLCRKSYVRQKKLEEIVSQRQLKRPGTKKWHVWLLVAILPFLSIYSWKNIIKFVSKVVAFLKIINYDIK